MLHNNTHMLYPVLQTKHTFLANVFFKFEAEQFFNLRHKIDRVICYWYRVTMHLNYQTFCKCSSAIEASLANAVL